MSRVLRIAVPADQVRAVRVFVTAPAEALSRPSIPVRFDIRSGAIAVGRESTFLSGAANQP
jgi:hypothetical protein